MNHILVIDDDPGVLEAMKCILGTEHYTVHLAKDGITGLQIIKKESIDLVFLDFRLPGMGGLEVLRETKTNWPTIEVVVISGYANVENVVSAMKLGALDYLEKPMDAGKVLSVARNAVRIKDIRYENSSLKNKRIFQDEMIGSSDGIQNIRKIVRQSAQSDASVILLGENGTGKELVAQMIHADSNRADRNFLAVNCAAIPDNLIESELFGHEKGAFTGATSSRRGKFEIADGGTLFLDEVADMSLEAQAKVLRAVQDLTFVRVGGEEPLHSDVRIISATNKDIPAEIRARRFREDLYFRLNVIPLVIPPLRERQEDIPDLLAYFQQKLNAGNRTNLFSAKAIQFLKKYEWPGNIRELKNFVERIIILADEEIVSEETVQYYLENAKHCTQSSVVDEYQSMKLRDARDMFELRLIEQRLDANNFNISDTAHTFGLSPSNLQNKIRKFGIVIRK